MNPLRTFFLLVSLLSATALSAAPGDLDQTFLTGIGAGLTPSSYPTFDTGTGAVNAVALQSTGKILAGGNISKFNNTGDLTALKRLHADGTLDLTFNAPGGTPGAGLAATTGQAEVNALLVAPDDKIYVGGTFNTYNGTNRGSFLRLHADGTLDETFAFTQLGGSARYVHAIALQPDGKVIIAGAFTSAAGVFRINLARLNPDGTNDATFTPSGYSTNGGLRALQLAPDGKLYVGGTTYNPTTQRNDPILHRLNPDGSRDLTFNPVFAADYGAVNSLLLLPDGRVLAGSDLPLPGYPQPTGLAAFNPDGSVDTAFMSKIAGESNGGALTLKLAPEGNILMGGIFTRFGGLPRASIVRLAPDGTIDPTFAPPPYAGRDTGYLTHLYSFAVQPDGRILAGGWFNRISDPELPIYNLVRFEGDYTAGPGRVGLTSPTYTFNENAGTVSISVARFGGITGAVSVDYSLTAGTATADDLALTSGTLSWANNEGGVKTFTIALTNDALAESLEGAVLTLSNLTGGATLGTSLGVVAIRDDDSPPAIVLQPIAVTLDQGETFSLYVGYDSVLPATAQWYRGNTLIPGATGPVYTVTNADPSVHGGNYSVRVTNANGTTTSQVVSVVIGVPAGALVTSFNPASSIIQYLSSGLDPAGNLLLAGIGANSTGGIVRVTSAGVVDPTFAPAFNSFVYSVMPLPDGSMLAGGSFTTVNGTAQNYFARINVDGTLDSSVNFNLPNAVVTMSLGAGNKIYLGLGGTGGIRRYALSGTNGVLDSTFTGPTLTGSGASMHNVKERADGKVFAAYNTGSSSSVTYNFRLLTSTGALDPSFTAPTIAGGPITDWDELPDGRTVVVGSFGAINGVTSRGIAVLLPDGSVDTSYDFTTAFVYNPRGVRYLNGRILVWGQFTTYKNTSVNGILRLNLDGTLDPTFKVGVGINSLGAINTVTVMPDHRLFLGGGFNQFRGVPRNNVALIEPGPGAVGFDPAVISVNENAGTVTLTLKRFGVATGAASINYATVAGTATAGADFTATSGTISWSAGDSANKTVTITLLQDTAIESAENFQVTLSNPVGEITVATSASITLLDDDSFPTVTQQPTGASLTEGQALTLTATATSPTTLSYLWYRNNQPIPTATSATYIVAATGGDDAGTYFLRITNAAGFVDTNPVTVTIALDPARRVSNFSFTTAITSNVRALVPLPTGGAYVGGDFTTVPGLTSGAYLMRVNDDGSLDTTYNPRPNSSIVAMVRQPDGKLLITGGFTQIAGVNRAYIARLNADGTLDTAFSTALGTGPNNTVNAIALLADGRIVIGGVFTSVNNVASTTNVALLKADGSVDTSFTSTANGSLTAITVQPDGKILIAGAFTTYGTRLARIGATGARDVTFTSGGTTSTSVIQRIRVLPDDRIAIVGTNLLSSSDFEILNANGTLAQNVSTFNTFNDVVVQDNGKLVAVGSFSLTGGTRIARFSPSGSPATYAQDTTFATGSGFNTTAFVVALAQNGNLWIGGGFTTYNGVSVNRLVKLNGEPVAVAITGQPADATVNPGATLNFSVSAIGNAALTYQWKKDGVDLANGGRISGATSAVLAITGATEVDEGAYSVVVTNATTNRSITSRTAAAVVLGAPEIVVAPGATEVNVGATLTLSATVRGVAPLTYEWRRNGQLIANGGRISGADTATLTITGSELTNGGAYTLTVINSLGTTATQSFDVSVLVLPGLRVPAFSSLAANSTVHQIFPLPDGGALVAGNFNTASGLTGANSTAGGPYLARVKPNGEIDPTFTVAPNSDIQRLAFAPDGGIIAAGYFTQVNSLAKNRLLRLNPDLTLDTTWTATGFSLAGIVKALAIDSTGRIYVGGTYNGFSNAYLPIAERFLPNGTKDTTFEWGGNNAIYHIDDFLIDAQDRVLIAGNSQAASGSQGLMRVLPSGAIDPSFPLNVIPSGSAIAYQITFQSDGKIIVGSTQGNPGVRRLTPDGAPDSTFTNYSPAIKDLAVLYNDRIALASGSNIVRLEPNGTPTTFPGPTTGFNSAPDNISVAETGTLWLGGSFTTYDGQTATRIIALNGDVPNLHISRHPIGSQIVEPAATVTFTARAVGTSAITYQWLKDGLALTNGPRITGADTATLTLTGALASDSANYTLRVTNDTGGTRTSANARLIVRDAPIVTAPLQSLYRTSGSSATFSVGAVGAGTLSYQWNKNGTAIPGAEGATYTIPAVNRADAGLYSVTITNPLGTLTSPAAALSVGTLADYSPVAIDNPSSFIEYRAVAKLPDGRFYVIGGFSSISGHSTYGLARFLANGAIDTSFVSPFTGGTPTTLATFSDGRVFVFGLIGPGSSGAHQLVNPDGTLSTFTSTALSGIQGSAQHAAVGPDGNLYVAYGYAVGSTGARPVLAKISPDGGVLATFTATGTPAISDFAFLSGDRLAAVGSWTKNSVTRYVDILDANFAPVPAFTAALTLNARVSDVAVLSDGDLLLGGQFTTVNSVSRNYLARINQDGTIDPAFLNGLTGPNGGFVNDLVPTGGGKILVLGSGSQFNGTVVNGFVRINEDGTIDPTYPLGTSPNIGITGSGYANAALVRDDGAIVLAGYNMPFKGVAISGLGYLTAPEDGTLAIVAEPAAITQPAGSAVTLTVAARGAGPLSFQWYKGTAAIPGATATSYTIAQLAEGDAASYTVTVTSGATTQTSAAATVAIGTSGNGSDTFGNYLAAAGVPANQRGPNDDPDGDGISNLLEYALAFNPAVASTSALPTPTVVGDRLTYIYERARTDVTYLVETTTNLADPNSWTTDGIDQGTPDAEGITIASAPLGTQRYFRLKVTRP